eukprot:6172153-Pleurochrysis_carterae.AAC.2
MAIVAEQDGDDAASVRFSEHLKVRCKDTGYYVFIKALYEPVVGFKVADGSVGDTLNREDIGATLKKCRLSAYTSASVLALESLTPLVFSPLARSLLCCGTKSSDLRTSPLVHAIFFTHLIWVNRQKQTLQPFSAKSVRCARRVHMRENRARFGACLMCTSRDLHDVR